MLATNPTKFNKLHRLLIDTSYVHTLLDKTYLHMYLRTLFRCDLVCEKGSYSLFNCMYLTAHNFACEFGITQQFCTLIPLTYICYDVI